MTLNDLYKTIKQRQCDMPPDSYVASLLRSGSDRVYQKIGEEATEVVIAAKNPDRAKVIEETADLIFHVLVMLAQREVEWDEVMLELKKRKMMRVTGS